MKVLLALILLFTSTAVGQQSSPAQTEFDALMTSYVIEYAGTIKGDQKAFQLAALPFGPLDLQVWRAKSYDEASRWKDFHLGVAGAASGVNPAALASSFHCGQSCIDYRRADMVKKLESITELVDDFNELSQIRLIANWGMKDAYRINNVFHMMGQTKESLPSPVMGFVPSDRWRDLSSVEEYLKEGGIDKIKFEQMLAKVKALNLAAVVREAEGSTRVVRVGISDNEAGLLFIRKPSEKPRTGGRLLSGKEYTIAEEVGLNVFYYETT